MKAVRHFPLHHLNEAWNCNMTAKKEGGSITLSPLVMPGAKRATEWTQPSWAVITRRPQKGEWGSKGDW